MNIYQVAELASVSIATVSRVMNGSDKVSEKTRSRVLQVIDEVGFTPNVFAQGLGLNTMHTIGILVPNISDIYMSSAVAYLQDSLAKYGYDLLLGNSGFEQEKKEQQTALLLSKHVDALIYVGSTYAGSGKDERETDYIRRAAEQVPVFVINGGVDGDNIYSSVCEDEAAVYNAAKVLIKKGCSKIWFLTDSRSYSAIKKRTGYERAIEEAGLNPVQLHVDNRIHKVRDYLLQHDDLNFDAVIAGSDAIAIGVMKYAVQKGLCVPEDIAVIGYNNSELALACEPELTSIDNHTEQICRDTVERMIKVFEAGGAENNIKRKLTVPCELVERGSS